MRVRSSRITGFIVLAATTLPLCVGYVLPDGAASNPILSSAEQSRVYRNFAALPAYFEPNQGQTDPQVRYFSRRHGYTLFLTNSGTVMAFRAGSPAVTTKQKGAPVHSAAPSITALRMRLVAAKPVPDMVADGELPGKSSYFLGNDSSKWRRNVPQFSQVSYRNVYPGVDLMFHDSQQELEFDFAVAPQADAHKIALEFDGASLMSVDGVGDLVLTTDIGEIHLHKPIAYQETTGVRHPVNAEFAIGSNGQVTFKLGAYDSARELIIDPSLAFSSYFGGSGEDDIEAISACPFGFCVTGRTNSINFPVAFQSGSGQQTKLAGGFDAFVSEIALVGADYVVYGSVYLGGSQDDEATAISFDYTFSPNVYVAGITSSTDFPIPGHAAQGAYGGGAQDAFVAELAVGNASFDLLYATYLGGSGSDTATAILNYTDAAWVAGGTFSTDFPTVNAYQAVNKGGEDGFLTFVDLAGGKFSGSTYLGGSQNDQITAMTAFDFSLIVTGYTASPDFPVTPGAPQTKCGSDGNCNGGLDDVFVASISADTLFDTYLQWATFLGGSGADEASAITLNPDTINQFAGCQYWIVGKTLSPDFPTTAGAFQAKCGTDGNCNGGQPDVFLASLTSAPANPPNLACTSIPVLSYSTFLGGSGDDEGTGVAQDYLGNVYVTGRTESTDFPTGPALEAPFQSTNAGGADAFITAFKIGGTPGPPLLYSSYLGGSGTENSLGGSSANAAIGAIYVYPGVVGPQPFQIAIFLGGNTSSPDFPVVNPLQNGQTYQGGASDGFVTILNDTLPVDTVFVTEYLPCPLYATSCINIGATNAIITNAFTFLPVPSPNFSYYPGTQTTLSSISTGGNTPVYWGGACAGSGYSSTCNLTVNTSLINVSAGVAPFIVEVNPTSTTITAGQSFTSTVTISALPNTNYSAQVALSCATYIFPSPPPGGPPPPPSPPSPPAVDPPTCSVSPSTVNLLNGGSATASFVVYTTGSSGALYPSSLKHDLQWAFGVWLPLGGLMLSGVCIVGSRREKKKWIAATCFLLAVTFPLIDCGGSGSAGGGAGGTTLGGYTFSINGAAADGTSYASLFTFVVKH
jgi:hypothetical protein